jgi:hypothetical protein
MTDLLARLSAAEGPSRELDARPCTCHPDDNPPQPCARKYALTECCIAAELAKEGGE